MILSLLICRIHSQEHDARVKALFNTRQLCSVPSNVMGILRFGYEESDGIPWVFLLILSLAFYLFSYSDWICAMMVLLALFGSVGLGHLLNDLINVS
jgi:hypothetical protein